MTPTATLTFRGRLPGVACDPALPTRDQPVRLDVAGFVGFAERGPLHVPVPIEDPLQYAAVFGADLALAQEAGRPVFAQLPSAVRAFFDNGGRRCHVVRVAGPDAVPGRWRVPGLQVWQPDGGVADAVVEAAWPGAWSAGTAVGAELLARHLAPHGRYERRDGDALGRLPLGRGSTVGLQPGDLLQLGLGGSADDTGLFVRVQGLDHGTSTVLVDLELAFRLNDLSTPDPDALSLLPQKPTVARVRLLRFDLVVLQHTPTEARVVDRMGDLRFGPSSLSLRPGRPYWADRLQAAGADQPDLTRSITLRQDADTMVASATGLAVPVWMSRPGSALDAAPPALQDGDDDLDGFDARWFLDPDLAGDTLFSVVEHADQLTVLAAVPRGLRGVHALMAVDEVALVAAPDALNRAWSPVVLPDPGEEPEAPEPEPVDWSDFRCCTDEPAAPEPLEPPVEPTPVDRLPELDRVSDYDEDRLVEVQVAIVTMCAGLADRVALLSVPAHYDVAATMAWHARLAADGRVADGNATGLVPLSYAAHWHPWLGLPASSGVARAIAPDGPVAGMIAARELARGCWIAAAGVPLRGVVRLASPHPLTDADDVLLFDAHANLVTRSPGAFSTLSAHTLTGDRQLLQLNVRRLLILLRKICLLVGHRYTFEVNNDRFRQLVRMRFDRILTALVERGALHAFRVVTDGSVNTAEDQDAGRLVVVLQVAPTSPVEFITVTLLRSGEGLLDVLEG